jgi:mannose-1-phosphate guanylyltransferase
VAFGTPPASASTAYGWLRPADAKDGSALALADYVEKPDANEARRLLDAGYLWNCGTFVFCARALLDAFARLAPDILEAARDIAAGRVPRDARRLSIDHAVLVPATRADLCAVVPVRYERVDVGRIEGLAALLTADARGNAVAGDAMAIDARDSVLWASEGAGALAALGVRDLVVVVEPDAVLVCRKSDDVRALLAELRARKREDLL